VDCPQLGRRRATALAGVVSMVSIVLAGCVIESSGRPDSASRGSPSLPGASNTQRKSNSRSPTVADGYVAKGSSISPFDDGLPAIARLDPDLRAALQAAAADAKADGFDMSVSTGWRSRRYQGSLFKAAVVQYGSREEARKWVLPPSESDHVKGLAVDIVPTDADSWLSQHGAKYGLCQTYANEIWHYELSVIPGGKCPASRTDSAGG
jgi:D-alanyl-D-alanine carboxypeptidase